MYFFSPLKVDHLCPITLEKTMINLMVLDKELGQR